MQIHNPPHSSFLHHQVTNQEGPGSPRTLNDFSIFDLPSDEHSSKFTALITQKDLDEIVPVDDDFLEALATLDIQQTIETSPSTDSSATFSHLPPSPTVNLVMLVTREQKGRVCTKTIKLKPTRSSCSGESPSITPAEYCGRAYQKSYHWASRLEMTNSCDKDLAKRTGRIAGQIASSIERVFVEQLLAYYTKQPPGEDSGKSCVGAIHEGYWTELTLSDDKAGKVAKKTRLKYIYNHPRRVPVPSPENPSVGPDLPTFGSPDFQRFQ